MERESLAVLGLKPGASFAVVRRRYRELVKALHPDVAGTAADARRLDAVVAAYRDLAPRYERAGGKHVGAGARAEAGAQGASEGAAEDRSKGGAGAASRNGTAPPQECSGLPLRELGRLIAESTQAAQRRTAVREAAGRGRKGYSFFRPALHDPDETVVTEALRGIARLRMLQAAGELSSVYNRGSAALRREVLAAVRSFARLRRFGALILMALGDGDETVRHEALSLFVRLKNEKDEQRVGVSEGNES